MRNELSPQAQDLFERTLVCERYVKMGDFSRDNIPILIYHQGWSDLLYVEGNALEEPTKLFYTNFHSTDSNACIFSTMVYGVTLNINPNVISLILRLPRPSNPVIFPPPDPLPDKEQNTLTL